VKQLFEREEVAVETAAVKGCEQEAFGCGERDELGYFS